MAAMSSHETSGLKASKKGGPRKGLAMVSRGSWTEDECLLHIMNKRFGIERRCDACTRTAKFHRVRGRRAFACSRCGTHLYPCVGTIFDRTRTPLSVWFAALELMKLRRHSSVELQRDLRIGRDAALRIHRNIRALSKQRDLAQAMTDAPDDDAFVLRELRHRQQQQIRTIQSNSTQRVRPRARA